MRRKGKVQLPRHTEINGLFYIPDLDGMTEGYGIVDAITMEKVAAVDSVFADEGKSFVSLVDMKLFRRMKKSRKVSKEHYPAEWLDEMATKARINVSAVTQSVLKEELGITS